ncbi:uncharacterized protein LOC133206113 [Saccostrea echinata]|uniref:uncharacterized protein LOC133206113 n=1 Tax=Saccostrea echinata TaxID=191078 RepID=UPI002A83FAAA|nr:uncharacterized protein LOC133206113 [Saccostrea echinata]
MTGMRRSVIVYFVGYLTFSCAHYPFIPRHPRPFIRQIYPNPPLFGGMFFHRPVFNIHARFHPRIGLPQVPFTNNMFHPHHKINTNCPSEKHSVGHAAVPSTVSVPSSYDGKNIQKLPVPTTSFVKLFPTIGSQPFNFVKNVADAPSNHLESNPSVALEVPLDKSHIIGLHPTLESETRRITGVKPTLRIENTDISNDTSGDHRNPDWNYFDFITNKDFIIKLIENKLIKLQNKEKIVGGISVNTQLYDQIKRIEEAMGITVALENGTTTVPPVATNSTGISREGQYTSLSTFMGNFFCAWCKSRHGSQKSTCLKFCFNDIIRKNNRAEEMDSTSR